MKILVTGANGQVGWEAQRALALTGEVFALGRERLELANIDSIRSVVLRKRYSSSVEGVNSPQVTGIPNAAYPTQRSGQCILFSSMISCETILVSKRFRGRKC